MKNDNIVPLGLRKTANAIAANYHDKGAIVISVSNENDVRIGTEGLTPEELRNALCVAINYSFEFETP